MCGIAGFIGQGSLTDLQRMMANLVHRGPDGAGTYIEPTQRVFFGHRRLAVLDLAGGTQPMTTADGALTVVFNGEIYNHQALRTQLVAAGHRFQTDHSDTEVLLHGYRHWGDDLPARLDGMFAFAIYDHPQQRLFLARDRFGKKPLYYHNQPGLFAFASELTALAAHPGVTAELNGDTLQQFFAFGHTLAPTTFFKHCQQLSPGSQLTYQWNPQWNRGRITVRSYWQFCLQPDETWASLRGEKQLADELRTLLQQAVSKRLCSDVPLGIFLSGGIDSSAILALAKNGSGSQTLHSFALGFTEPSFDESRYAQQVAQQVGSQHHTTILTLEQAQHELPTLLGNLDEPFADPSLLPTFLLSRFARQQVTVALGGDGGDELFAGYDPFAALAPAQIYHACVPRRLHQGMRWLFNRLPIADGNMSLDFKLRRTLMGLSYPPELWCAVWMAPIDPQQARDLFVEPLPLEAVYAPVLERWQQHHSSHPIDWALHYFTQFYLQNGVLTKLDRASMQVSLEARTPFLDNEVVAFAQKLPYHYKYRHGQRKYLLQQALAQDLPHNIIHRRKKGFGIPLAAWMRQMPFPEYDWDSLGLRGSWLRTRWLAHQQKQEDNRFLLWNLWCLKYWLEAGLGRKPIRQIELSH